LNFLSQGFLGRIGLIPNAAKASQIYRRLTIKFLEIYHNAFENKEILGNSILDNIIRHNRKCKKEGRTKDFISDSEIVGNLFLFQFAGSDTSFHTLSNTICYLAQNSLLQSRIRSLSQVNFEKVPDAEVTPLVYERITEFNLIIKELLRLHAPVTRIVMREAIKDFKLYKKGRDAVHIKKGTMIIVPVVPMHYNDKKIALADQFDENKFSKERVKNIPRYQYGPFYHGKRNCLGQNLGDLLVRIILTELLNAFEITVPDNFEYRMIDEVLYMVEKAYVKLSPVHKE